ncbi:acyltransferase family protein [Pseudorhodobacter wandonensis]|uniref:acyltransferase family protein n=1 Tax=Pseudorhodobacter wandonensis TaxID=1120568 RepID=UPI00067AABB0|nr:acyltransferase [Pseudorhodobacter wandonensis]
MRDTFPRNGQIPSLDGLRAVSILVVFASHAGVSAAIPGGFGVTVFFFLSGYLITTLLLREQSRTGGIDLRAFYMRRLLRLGPPILVTLALGCIMVWLGVFRGEVEAWTLASQLFFYYNYFVQFGERHEIFGSEVLWSLSIEEHFYLLWPALFLAIQRGRIGLRFVLVLLVASLLWRWVRFVPMGHDELLIYISSDTRLDGLLYGCLLALMQARGLAERWMPQGAARHGVILVALGVILASFVLRDPVFRSTLRYSVQGAALMPLFYYAVTRAQDWYFRPLNWTWVRQIGVWSFTVYLCHFAIIQAFNAHGLALGSLQMVALAGAVSLGYAALVAWLVERPVMRWRRVWAR